ncbi:MAG TPA: hypothetical protein VF612_03640 [Jatrophihabitans sp.]|uniref:hypothetical protein n=1 Tax=Jatrophihabitans sp. TaxID=1932789 RepID=UPI002F1C00AE
MNIDVSAPDRAPARTDLPFLRHRARFRPAAQPAVPAAQPAATGASGLDLSRPAARPAAPAARPAAPAATGSSGLDLSRPNARPAAPAATGSSSLDLSRPAAPAARPAATPPSAAPAASPATSRRVARPLPRARSGERTLLTPKAPTITLNRLQSGIGVLTIEAACSPAVGDLRIGAAYELADGHSSLVSRVGGIATAPRNSRRPVIVARAEQYERLMVDLRQSRHLDRLVVYGFSESGSQLNWGGTLVLGTAGGARVELPLDRPPSGGVTVLLSIYNVHGEFVVRAEMEDFTGSIRNAVQAYGFDRISWLDDRTPVA